MSEEADVESGVRRWRVRPYEARDREAVRRICCETGFLGEPIDPVFEDRDVFADILTAYYTDREPESCFVVERDGEVRGYLMGSRHHARQKRFGKALGMRVAGRALWRCFTRPYGKASRRYMWWVVTRSWREVPEAPKGLPHFHINLLKDVRGVGETRELIDRFLEYLRECGERQVYGQMVVFDDRRGERMFARYGFKVLNRGEVTKFRRFHEGKVFLFTVVKDIGANTRLYGKDLWREGGGEPG